MMPFISARFAKPATAAVFALTISANTTNANLHTLAVAAGYMGGACTVTINSGVEIYSTSSSTAALVPGSFPSSVVVKIINNGTVSGAGGNGGNGNSGGGAAGGTALDASSVSGYTLKVDNTSGVLRGGGGGGGGGANAYYCADSGGGGGGGGGQGRNGGAGGSGAGSSGPGFGAGANGGNGTATAPGAGGGGGGGLACGPVICGCTGARGCSIPVTGGTGGNGGAWGAAGSSSSGPGGAAGHSVVGSANITWTANGTRTGPIS